MTITRDDNNRIVSIQTPHGITIANDTREDHAWQWWALYDLVGLIVEITRVTNGPAGHAHIRCIIRDVMHVNETEMWEDGTEVFNGFTPQRIHEEYFSVVLVDEDDTLRGGRVRVPISSVYHIEVL